MKGELYRKFLMPYAQAHKSSKIVLVPSRACMHFSSVSFYSKYGNRGAMYIISGAICLLLNALYEPAWSTSKPTSCCANNAKLFLLLSGSFACSYKMGRFVNILLGCKSVVLGDMHIDCNGKRFVP